EDGRAAGSSEIGMRRSDPSGDHPANRNRSVPGERAQASIRGDPRHYAFSADRKAARIHPRDGGFPARMPLRCELASSPSCVRDAVINSKSNRSSMALLTIRKYPDDTLKQRAKPVDNINGTLNSLVESMVQTMYAAPGVGLAAPQVGESRRVIVLDTDHEQPG